MTEPFARHLCKIIVAQICKQMGFQAIKASASEALVDLLIKYIEEIGTRSHDFAELGGRTESNFMDVKQTFQDLNVKLIDLITFVNTDDVQFPVAVPDFPVPSTENSLAKTNSKPDTLSKPEPLPSYVPDHLPPFPDPHSWKQTPTYSVKKIATGADARQARKSKVKELRHQQESVAKLNEKLGSKPIFNYETAKNTIGNPYLAAPEIPREPLTQTIALPQTPQYNPTTPATPSQFASDIHDDTTASYVSPTPLRKDSAFYKTVLQTKPFDETDSDEPKRVMNSEEEVERNKKRLRAEQILKQQENEIVDI